MAEADGSLSQHRMFWVYSFKEVGVFGDRFRRLVKFKLYWLLCWLIGVWKLINIVLLDFLRGFDGCAPVYSYKVVGLSCGHVWELSWLFSQIGLSQWAVYKTWWGFGIMVSGELCAGAGTTRKTRMRGSCQEACNWCLWEVHVCIDGICRSYLGLAFPTCRLLFSWCPSRFQETGEPVFMLLTMLCL